MSTVSTRTESRPSLLSATWETYFSLRDDPDNLRIRMTFDEGRLELMSPSGMHEALSYLIGRLIDLWTLENGIPVRSLRSVTLRRADLRKGLEPDNCYYIQNESAIRGRDELDLELDPPPDLAIEIDVASSSLSRMSIYATLGVPELWRWADEHLEMLQLQSGVYQSVVQSGALKRFPIQLANDLLRRRNEMDETSLVQLFRDSIRHRQTDS